MSPRKKCSWSPRKMKLAVNAVRNGAKLRSTAAVYGVPVMTLSDYVKRGDGKRFVGMGRKPVFTAVQETEIRDQLLCLAKEFYGLTPHSLKVAVYEYAEKNKINPNPFNKDKKEAGKDWLYGFLKRNPELSIRRPEATSINRILAFNSEEIKTYFDNLSLAMTKYNFPPHRIYNVDETGIDSVHEPGRIVAPKGVKQVGAATSWQRGQNITTYILCCCINATGQYIPPMIIYPRIRMHPSLEIGGPNGTLYKCSKSGWMTEELFKLWLEHFMTHARATLEDPVLLILDNHCSHISLDIYHYCRENGIVMVTLPPHTSHRTQPLDLTVFGSLKNALNKECHTYMNINRYEKLTPIHLIPLFTRAYLNIANAEKAVNGFKTAGIWPFDPNVFQQLFEGDAENTNETVAGTVDLDSEPETSAIDEDVTLQKEYERPSTSGMNNRMQEKPQRQINDPYNSQHDDEHPPVSDFVNIEEPEPERFSVDPETSQHDVAIHPPKSACSSTSILNNNLAGIERAKRKIFSSDHEVVESATLPISQPEVSFSQISPLPIKNKIDKGKGQGKRSKQHSIFLTSTPMKDVLESQAVKREAKKIKQEKGQKSRPKKRVGVVKGSKKQIKKITNNSTSSSDNDIAVPYEEDDSDDVICNMGESGIEEICVICGEFGKNQDMWYRCVACGKWAHALCSGEDSADKLFVYFVC